MSDLLRGDRLEYFAISRQLALELLLPMTEEVTSAVVAVEYRWFVCSIEESNGTKGWLSHG